MVSGTMALTVATLKSGSAAVKAQRGTQTWGANYIFSPSGVQNDIAVIADAFVSVKTSGTFIAPTISGNISLSTSGTTAIGTANLPLAVSGLVMLNQAGLPMKLVITAGGLVSGIAA